MFLNVIFKMLPVDYTYIFLLIYNANSDKYLKFNCTIIFYLAVRNCDTEQVQIKFQIFTFLCRLARMFKIVILSIISFRNVKFVLKNSLK